MLRWIYLIYIGIIPTYCQFTKSPLYIMTKTQGNWTMTPLSSIQSNFEREQFEQNGLGRGKILVQEDTKVRHDHNKSGFGLVPTLPDVPLKISGIRVTNLGKIPGKFPDKILGNYSTQEKLEVGNPKLSRTAKINNIRKKNPLLTEFLKINPSDQNFVEKFLHLSNTTKKPEFYEMSALPISTIAIQKPQPEKVYFIIFQTLFISHAIILFQDLQPLLGFLAKSTDFLLSENQNNNARDIILGSFLGFAFILIIVFCSCGLMAIKAMRNSHKRLKRRKTTTNLNLFDRNA